MLLDVLRRWRDAGRARELAPWCEDTDLPAFRLEVARQRRRGARIGRMVRLLGTVDGVNPNLVEVGDYSVIGVQSALLAHCPIRGGLPCVVGSFVYVGFGVLVLPGVKIGDHALIGAGSVVTRSVPPGSIVVGNPGRVIRHLTEEESRRIEITLREGKVFRE